MSNVNYQLAVARAAGYRTVDDFLLAYLKASDKEAFARNAGVPRRSLDRWAEPRFKKTVTYELVEV